MATVEITSKAEEHLDGLDPQARERILKKLDEAREDGSPARPIDRLGVPQTPSRGLRAIIAWDREQDRLIVEAVGHRRNVYDRHLPP